MKKSTVKFANLLSAMFVVLVLVLACVWLLPTDARAAGEELTFKLNDDGVSYCVSDCSTTAAGKLTVPATYNGKPVTAIGHFAFSGCTELTGITLPDSIEAVGINAFHNCLKLTYNVSDGVKYLGSDANPNMVAIGYASSGLTHLRLHKNTKIIYDNAFQKNYSVTSVTLNDGLVTIGNGAFYDSTVLTSITIPDSVTTMGEAIFHGCYRIKSVIIGDGVTSIGSNTFSACSALEEIAIGNKVARIDAYAFENCTGMKAVLYKGSQAAWDKILVADGNDALLGANLLVDFKGAESEYTVVFKNWDGTVLSTKTYKYGAVVTAPAVPDRPGDEENTYTFAGWDKTVTNCMGNADYTAVFTPVPVEPPTEPTTAPTEPIPPIVLPTEPFAPTTDPTEATEPSVIPTEPADDGEKGSFPTGIITAVCVIAVALAVTFAVIKKKK